MKVVILAGGYQSTLSNEREGIPKPMVEIGGKPLLWHIMKQFAQHGMNEFVVCGGYRVDMIKEYFKDFYIYESDITVDLATNTIEVHRNKTENWIVTVVDTGLYATTGQRVSLIEKYITEDSFLVSYGDCLFDIDIPALLEYHNKSGKEATLVMAKPNGRNKLLPIDESGIIRFNEPETADGEVGWINADCFVFSRKVFPYLQGNYDLEKQLFVSLSERSELAVYKHSGFWTAVETKRDLTYVENLWSAGLAPWLK